MVAIKAHIEGNVIIPDEPINLPNGTRIEVYFERTTTLTEAEPPKRYLTGRELAESEVVGMWADREDMADPVAYVNKMREEAERRRREP